MIMRTAEIRLSLSAQKRPLMNGKPSKSINTKGNALFIDQKCAAHVALERFTARKARLGV